MPLIRHRGHDNILCHLLQRIWLLSQYTDTRHDTPSSHSLQTRDMVPQSHHTIQTQGMAPHPATAIDRQHNPLFSNSASLAQLFKITVRLKVLPEQLTLIVNTSVAFKKCIIQ